MLGVVISLHGASGAPVDTELVLLDPVLDPEVAHVHCLGAALFYPLVGNASGHQVVRFHRGGWLQVSHFH